MKRSISGAILVLALAGAAPGWAQQASVAKAWVRGAVAGQNATGAFMEITAAADSTLVGAASPAAKSVEIHEMSMEGGVMKMRAVKSVALPAGKPVEFKPGGYHVMLIGLNKPLKEGDSVPIELTLQARDQKRSKLSVTAEVRPLGTPVEEHHHH